MTPPRISADTAERLEACPTSLAKEHEVHDFALRHGIPGLSEAVEETRGVRLRAVLEALPYRRDTPMQSDVLSTAIRAEAARHGVALEAGDLWFCFNAIRRRDLLIEDLCNRIGPTSTLRVHNGDCPVSGNFSVRANGQIRAVAMSERANVVAVAQDAAGRSHVLVLDYETGFVPAAEGHTNRQYSTLAVLAAKTLSALGPVASVGVSLLARNDEKSGEITLHTFDQAQLVTATKILERTLDSAVALRDAYQADAARGHHSPPPALEAKLRDAATPGDHCESCRGKTCCSALRQAMGEYERVAIAPTKGLPENLAYLVQRAKSNPNPEKIMTPQELADTLTVATKIDKAALLFKATRNEAEELARQMAAKGIALPGVSVKEGSRRFVLRANETVSGADKKPVEKPIDTTPQAVFARLKGVLPGITEETFIRLTCDTDPARVRALIADQAKVPEPEVYDLLAGKLTSANPFEMRPNKLSVSLAPAQQQAKTAAPAAVMPPLESAPAQAATKPARGRK